MLPLPETLEETVGLLLRQAATLDRRTQAHAGVPDTDVPDHGVELALLARHAQSLRLLVGNPTGFDHLVDMLQETLALALLRLVARPALHEG